MRKPISLSLPPPSIPPYIMTINLHQQQQQQQQQLAQVGGDTNPTTSVHSFPISDSISTHTPITLDLFRSEIDSFPVELEEPSPLPLGWQRFLNLKTGEIYYTKEKEEMSRHGKSPKLDLKLNLSPPRGGSVFMNMNNHNQQQQGGGGGGGGGGGVGDHQQSPNGSSSAMSSPTSPPSSCVSSENNNSEETSTLRYSNSPEATSMVLVGCPRCLMYVMLSEEDPKCPKCKSTVLLDFLHDNNNNNNNKNKNKKRNNN